MFSSKHGNHFSNRGLSFKIKCILDIEKDEARPLQFSVKHFRENLKDLRRDKG
jgi:hypothetical protein